MNKSMLRMRLAFYNYGADFAEDHTVYVYPAKQSEQEQAFSIPYRNYDQAVRETQLIALGVFRETIANFPEWVKEALCSWYADYGVIWDKKLTSAWHSGNYGDLSSAKFKGVLRRFHQNDGPEYLESLNLI